MSLIEYIKGRRHGKDAHRLERESMQDSLLYDAIDGFDSVEGNHTERIAEMRRRISRRSGQNSHRITYLSIAASLVVLFTIGGYFLFNDKQDDFMAKGDYSHEGKIAEDADASIQSEEKIITEDEISIENDRQISQESPAIINDVRTDDSKESLNALNAGEAEAPIVVDSGKISDENILANVEDQIQIKEDSNYIADATQKSEDAVEKTGVKTPVSSGGTGLSQSATGQQKKPAAKLETPEPKIGWKDYRKYLKDSLRRPSGDCAKSKGTVEVTFHIDENGIPYDYVIGKSLCPDADAEAIRLVKEGCLWTCKSFRRMTVEVKF